MTLKTSPIRIRPVTPADEPEWRRLWTDYLDFYETRVDEDIYRTSFARLLSDEPHEFRGLLAEVDGHAAGLVHYLFHRHMWKASNVCYLQDLYAEPQMRGRGVGRALIEAVYRAADSEGAPDVYWLTQEFNTTARRLYDRIGACTPFIRYVRPPRDAQ